MTDLIPLDQIIIAQRAANEGIPVGAIARIVQQPFGTVHVTLREALALGKIGGIPKADWPPGIKFDDRTPTIPRSYNAEDLEFHCRKVFKLTLLEAGFMTALLRADCASKENLHSVGETQRMRRHQRPDKLEMTDMKIVDVVVCKLRKKLKTVSESIVLTTSWGRGYYFDTAVKAQIYALIGGTYGGGPETRRSTH